MLVCLLGGLSLTCPSWTFVSQMLFCAIREMATSKNDCVLLLLVDELSNLHKWFSLCSFIFYLLNVEVFVFNISFLYFQSEVVTFIGFLEDAPNIDVHGFSVYHKNRLILVRIVYLPILIAFINMNFLL